MQRTSGQMFFNLNDQNYGTNLVYIGLKLHSYFTTTRAHTKAKILHVAKLLSKIELHAYIHTYKLL